MDDTLSVKKKIVNSITIVIYCLILPAAIQAQPTEDEEGFIDVDYGQLYYQQKGQGQQTIVFIHDGLVHHEIWDAQFDIFSENFRVIRYDRRGYGRSLQPETSYSNIEDLKQVFNELNVPKAILIGISSGGGLVLDFTLAHPDKVSAMVLVGAVVSGFGYTEHLLTRGGRLSAEIFNDPPRLIRYLVREDPYEIASGNQKTKDKLAELLAPYLDNIDMSKRGLRKNPMKPAIDQLNTIQQPALIMVGEFDIPDVHAHAGAINAGIANSRRLVISQAGHLVPLEQPQRFNQEVKQFLQGLELFRILAEKGPEAAIEFFKSRKKQNPDWQPFSEQEMNMKGYQQLRNGYLDRAITMFKLNCLAFPHSYNVYDSLAEGYMIKGETEAAILNYKTSLEINPQNNNAREKLKTLRINQPSDLQ